MRLLFFVTCCLFVNVLFAQYSINPSSRAASVLIKTAHNKGGSGVIIGDSVKNNMYLVTARHVFFREFKDANNTIVDSITFLLYRMDVDRDPPVRFSASVHTLLAGGNLSMDSANDVIVIRFAKTIIIDSSPRISGVVYLPGVAKLTPNTRLQNWPIEGCQKMEDIVVGTDAYTIGFPTSINYFDAYSYNKPLLRKGIIAGKQFNTNRIICDMPIHPGNSGGGVFSIMLERSPEEEYISTRLIGIAVAHLPFDDNPIDKDGKKDTTTRVRQNTGYSLIIPCDIILQCISRFD